MHPRVLGFEEGCNMTYSWDRVPMLKRDRHLHKINLSSIKALKPLNDFVKTSFRCSYVKSKP